MFIRVGAGYFIVAVLGYVLLRALLLLPPGEFLETLVVLVDFFWRFLMYPAFGVTSIEQYADQEYTGIAVVFFIFLNSLFWGFIAFLVSRFVKSAK